MSGCFPSSPRSLHSLVPPASSSPVGMRAGADVGLWVTQLQASTLPPPCLVHCHATQPLGLPATGVVYSQTW